MRAPLAADLVLPLAGLSLVVLVVFVGDEVGLNHHRDVRRVELRVDHRAIADETAQPQIPLDQRRQLVNAARVSVSSDQAAACRHSGVAVPWGGSRAGARWLQYK